MMGAWGLVLSWCLVGAFVNYVGIFMLVAQHKATTVGPLSKMEKIRCLLIPLLLSPLFPVTLVVVFEVLRERSQCEEYEVEEIEEVEEYEKTTFSKHKDPYTTRSSFYRYRRLET